jgi:hypothetical protein
MRNAVHLPLINRIAAALGANTQLEVVVEGHTDSTGARSFNMHRSQRRARAAATHVESVTEWWFSMTEKNKQRSHFTVIRQAPACHCPAGGSALQRRLPDNLLRRMGEDGQREAALAKKQR